MLKPTCGNNERPSRLELTTRQLAGTLDSRLYGDALTDADIRQGCTDAVQWGLASVIVRPEHLPLAATTVHGSNVGVATALEWRRCDDDVLDSVALVAEAESLAAAGATELGLMASKARLLTNPGQFTESLEALQQAMSPLGVRTRVIVDTEGFAEEELQGVCEAATNAYVWMLQGGSWRGQRAGMDQIQTMRSALPGDVLLKWTEPIRRVETMLLCIGLGIDRFNADIDTLMASAVRAEWSGPLMIPQAGIDY